MRILVSIMILAFIIMTIEDRKIVFIKRTDLILRDSIILLLSNIIATLI
ncbi:hypothetical protein [Clostridium cadaveris]|nr:hypothetical protein [Clostridium cadaveris]NWK11765.1 hypothetical protein [Clostridium cadaveris]